MYVGNRGDNLVSHSLPIVKQKPERTDSVMQLKAGERAECNSHRVQRVRGVCVYGCIDKAVLCYYIATGVALRVSMPTEPMCNISLCGPLSRCANRRPPLMENRERSKVV